jgi:hypothetical protein
MFLPLRTDVDARFLKTESFFQATRRLQGDDGATAKGLVFIQLYAAYEFTVRSVVQISIDAINAHGHKMNELSPSLLALYLDGEMNSLRDAGRRNIWRARLRVLERAFSGDLLALPNNAGPPSDGSHYRHTHLQIIFEVFGIRGLPVRRRKHLYRIDEVVDNRNKIAHGNETAFEVGRRYTSAEIAHVIKQMKSVCYHLVGIFQNFCADGARHKRE